MAGSLSAQNRVNGYTNANGTYVQPYYRSNANGTVSDNWSTYGNTNPYTGQRGTYHVPTPGIDYTPAPSYNASPSYSVPSGYGTGSYNGNTLYSGPRGGQYYINSNGNRTYVPRP
jgi:hypothetical protein